MSDHRTTRRVAVVASARNAGLLAGPNVQLGARMPRSLIETAKAKSGLDSTTDLIQYALAKVALEDDYGSKLLALKGSITADLNLEL